MIAPRFNPDRDNWFDNYLTHQFAGDEGDERCLMCDCRPGGAWATWPCGIDTSTVMEHTE